MIEMPPMLTGTTQQQLDAMRDYLVRLVREMETLRLELEELREEVRRS